MLRFTEINISDHKLAKHYFNMLTELNKYGIETSVPLLVSVRPELKHSVVDEAVDQWRQGTAV